jgi:L-phenylalanine/L-methionine N-acetyltransferase
MHMDITVRHSEPDDYREIHRIFSGPRAIAGTLQMPFPRAEMWRERLSEPPEGLYSLVACVEGEVVGSLGLETSPTRWRMHHVGSIGMAVRDDWQGKGVGTALMEAALDLADNWLNLTRI